jgi:hypothetical protein
MRSLTLGRLFERRIQSDALGLGHAQSGLGGRWRLGQTQGSNRLYVGVPADGSERGSSMDRRRRNSGKHLYYGDQRYFHYDVWYGNGGGFLLGPSTTVATTNLAGWSAATALLAGASVSGGTNS